MGVKGGLLPPRATPPGGKTQPPGTPPPQVCALRETTHLGRRAGFTLQGHRKKGPLRCAPPGGLKHISIIPSTAIHI
ncbi:MAG: hypothetical protein DRN55_06600 [Thermoplasmata archaeon]|nr:MAG: hypothetical protein DRN55_06600 [Thermoplasmata archaeon]